MFFSAQSPTPLSWIPKAFTFDENHPLISMSESENTPFERTEEEKDCAIYIKLEIGESIQPLPLG